MPNLPTPPTTTENPQLPPSAAFPNPTSSQVVHPLRVYSREERSTYYLYDLVDKKAKKGDNMKETMVCACPVPIVAVHVPIVLHPSEVFRPSDFAALILSQTGLPLHLMNLTREWTPAEWVESGFSDLTQKEARLKIDLLLPDETHITSWPISKYLSPKINIEAGRGEDIAILQKHLLDPKVKDEYLKAQGNWKQHVKKRGTAFDITWSVQPTRKAGVAKAVKLPVNSEVIEAMARIVKSAFKEHMPEYELDFMRRDWIKSVSCTYGDENQNSHTSIQINVTIPDVNGNILTKSIGPKGLPHIDPNDMPASHTIIVFASRCLDPEFFYGRFIQHGMRLSCPTQPYGILIQSSKFPHSAYGAGTYPADTPENLRSSYPEDLVLPTLPAGLEGKLHLASYARNDLWTSTRGKRTVLLSLNDALVRNIFATRRNYEEYHIRFDMYHRDDNDQRSAEEWALDAKYTWVEDGKTQHPELHIAEEMLREDVDQDKLMKTLNDQLLASGLGSRMPKDPSASAKRKVPPGVKGEVNVVCRGTCKSGKPCSINFRPSRNPNGYCGTHQYQTDVPNVAPEKSARELEVDDEEENGGPSKRQRLS